MTKPQDIEMISPKHGAMHLGWIIGTLYGLTCLGPPMTSIGLSWEISEQNLGYFDGLLASVIGAIGGLLLGWRLRPQSSTISRTLAICLGQIGMVLLFSPGASVFFKELEPLTIWAMAIFLGGLIGISVDICKPKIRTVGGWTGIVIGAWVGWLLLEYPIKQWLMESKSLGFGPANIKSQTYAPILGAFIGAIIGYAVAPIAKSQSQKRIVSPYGLIASILAFGIWLVPMGLTGAVKATLPAYPPAIRNQFRIACLFTTASRTWPTVHYEVLQEGNWKEGPLEGFFDIDIFGYRSRFNRIVSASRRTSKHVVNLENVLHKRCIGSTKSSHCGDNEAQFKFTKPDDYFQLRNYSKGCLTGLGKTWKYNRRCIRNRAQQWKLRNKTFNGVKGFQIQLHETQNCLSMSETGEIRLNRCKDTENELWKKSKMISGKNKKRVQEISNYIGERWHELYPDEPPLEAVRITIANHPVGQAHCMAKEAWSRPALNAIPKKHLREVGVFSVERPNTPSKVSE